MKYISLGLVLAGCGLLSGCATKQYHAEFASRLASADASMHEGDLAGANRILLDTLGVIHKRGEREYALQRFLAVRLLAEVNERASNGDAFLEEAGEVGTVLGSGPNRRHSIIGHVLAASYYAGRLFELADRVKDAPRRVDDVELAPGRLETVDAATGSGYARMIIVAAYSRLGFTSAARTLLRQVPQFDDTTRRAGLHADQRAEALLDEWQVTDATRASIYLEAFRMHRDRGGDPGLAYRYGIRARTHAMRAGTGDSPLGGIDDEVVQWANDETRLKGTFRSSRGTLFGPNVRECESSGEPVLAFTFEPNAQ